MPKRSCDYVDALPTDAQEIPGFPKYYATPAGEIYSGVRGRLKRRRFGRNACGYPIVSLTQISGNQMHPMVHRIIAKMFVPGEAAELTVNHKDLNKCNPAASNLEWISFSANQRHWRALLPESVKLAEANSRAARAQAVWAFDPETTRPVKRFEAISDAAHALGFSGKRLSGGMANICGAATYYGVSYGYLWRREDRQDATVDMLGILEPATGIPHSGEYRPRIAASELRPTGDEIKKVKPQVPRELPAYLLWSKPPKAAASPVARVLAPAIDDFA